MAAVLKPNQWELGGVVFGAGCLIDQDPIATPPMYGVRTQDQAIPGRDGDAPGSDTFEPGVWKFSLWTNAANQDAALEALAELAMAWRGDAYRDLPGKSTELRYRIGSRATRVVYGRPREFDYTLGPESLSGRIPITCNFKVMSELFYADYDDSQLVTHKEPETGGFVTPIIAPFSSLLTAGAGHPHTFTVTGKLPSPTTIQFQGPLDTSGILIDGQPYVDFQRSIPAGVKVTVDARPWVMSVYRDDGAAVAGLLSPRSRMPKMLLKPGQHTATLLGTSPDGTGKAWIRVRPAYPTV